MGSKIAARERMRAAGVPIVPGTTEPLAVGRDADPARRGARLAARDQGIRRRRRQGAEGRSLAGRGRPRPSTRPGARARRTSPTPPSTSSATSRIRATSRCRCSPTPTATSSTSASATARSSGATRSSSRRRRRPRSTPRCARGSAQIAVDAARAVGYRSAGTIEGLLSREGEYFFLEMNTRIQVEHTVTELVTGLDLVREQVLDRGRASRCRCRQEDVGFERPCDRVPDQRRGRVGNGFLPGAGDGSRATASRAGPGVRVDSGVGAGSEISPLYDPMVAKLIVLRRRSRAGAAADAARARRVRDRRRARRSSASTGRCSRTRASSPARRATGSWSRRSSRSKREQLSHEATTLAPAADGRLRAPVEASSSSRAAGSR